MKKEIISMACAAALCTSVLSACAPYIDEGPQTNTEITSDTGTETSAVIESVSENTALSSKKGFDTTKVKALELTRMMGNGIDLGNTHEAYGHGKYPPDSDPKVFEGLWGQPSTTQEIISGMKAAGFDTVRVPVAWTNAMDYESGDYTIDPKMLDRIGEVIDYAVNADMYVIVNDHWDGSWWGMFGSASQETKDKAMDMYISMWTQISERYKDKPDNLIFESANEELGDRLNDKDVAKDSGTLSRAECFETTNRINQTFVDTVRSTGGNNDDRFLLIAGYNTDIENTCNNAFRMPEDTVKDKLLVSVHYYGPSDYCLFQSVNHWGNKKQYEEQNKALAKLTKFTEQGYGVVIGEYGVLSDSSEPRQDWDLWFTNFIANCDLYNYVPVLWDCNGLYNKQTAKIKNKDVADFFLKRSNAAREGVSEEQIQKDAQKAIDDGLANAAEKAVDKSVPPADDDTAVAWIMYQSADWSISYSVGDVYDPTSKSDGIKAVNPVITGAGEYTASLDFTDAGKPKGLVFSALGVFNGERLYPGCIIDIKSVKINGEETELAADGYTTSDDGKCTRVNLYNQWVGTVPASPRTAGGAKDVSPMILIIPEDKVIETIEITFDFIT
ncbi:MAG: glycoside hydrolase family 5 protein [Oscillospiraceae bacterium]|nr:glycoside hydrolase family 5 protein [Oscillospiraceae bacterium]